MCFRLYSEAEFLARAEFTDPEIRRAALGGVILRMLSLGLGDIEQFPFLEPPDPRAIADGWQQLSELGAVDPQRKLTAIGKQMAKLPVDVKPVSYTHLDVYKRQTNSSAVASTLRRDRQ